MKEIGLNEFKIYYKVWKILTTNGFYDYSNMNSAYLLICNKINKIIWNSSVILSFAWKIDLFK